jgi:hypothetical protein
LIYFFVISSLLLVSSAIYLASGSGRMESQKFDQMFSYDELQKMLGHPAQQLFLDNHIIMTKLKNIETLHLPVQGVVG